MRQPPSRRCCATCPARTSLPSIKHRPHHLAHLMEVICLTTSAGECRSIKRLWMRISNLQAAGGSGSSLLSGR